VCISTDKTWFASHHVAVPKTLDDLTKPAYKGLLVAENPATSSTGLAFLAATVARFGAKGWRSYWAKLRKNDVQVVAGWEQAYEGAFSAGDGHGDRPLVVSYASSPPAAVYYADPRPTRSPVGTMLATCLRQIEFVGVLHGAAHRRAAEKFVDFMLSRRFQNDMPLQMFVFPVRDDATPPKIFTKFADVPPHPLSLSATEIGRNRDRWIEQWTDTVLR
jgi:thiamine transport system substrate-binding protein